MCEWVNFCPSSWKPIEKAPCRISRNFMPEVDETLDWVWRGMLQVLEADQAFINRLRNVEKDSD